MRLAITVGKELSKKKTQIHIMIPHLELVIYSDFTKTSRKTSETIYHPQISTSPPRFPTRRGVEACRQQESWPILPGFITGLGELEVLGDDVYMEKA